MPTRLRDTIAMNSIAAIALAWVAALVTCSDKELPGRQLGLGLDTGLSLPQALPPACGECTLPTNFRSTAVLDALKATGPGVYGMKDQIRIIFNTTYSSTEEIKTNIESRIPAAIASMNLPRDSFATAFASLDSCPAIASIFQAVRKNADSLMLAVADNMVKHITSADADALVGALVKGLSAAVPQMFTLVRDGLFHILQISAPDMCPTIGPQIYTILEPNGLVAKALAALLNVGSSSATEIVKNFMGDLLPGGLGGSLDCIGLGAMPICAVISNIGLDVDIYDITGGVCSNDSGNFDATKKLNAVMCTVMEAIGLNSIPGLVGEDFCSCDKL